MFMDKDSLFHLMGRTLDYPETETGHTSPSQILMTVPLPSLGKPKAVIAASRPVPPSARKIRARTYLLSDV